MNIAELFENEIKPRFQSSDELLFHRHIVREIIKKYDTEDITEVLNLVISTIKQEDYISLRIMKALIDILLRMEDEQPIAVEKIESVYLTSIERGYEHIKAIFISPPPVMVADPRDFEDWDIELCKVTLGERKSFAKRMDRRMIERLLKDPNPDVIRILLLNPRLFESDVIALGARRPNFGSVLMEIYMSYRWKHNRRVIHTLVRNPYTPPVLSIKLTYLLPRTELIQVLNDTELHPAIRDVARYMLK